ncbi:hypothetical protein D2E26_1061 [Bifidobacterium dolichotidis]|uniref:DNA and RNA helicase-like protein n=2 Tax=Bifidobacterium dolichotidis TaxID=2306976 RepID=A0A430FQA2_9BIFI|nr:hypothetical protein D2E26_1061 [Bifidobacterium dolichotidis]
MSDKPMNAEQVNDESAETESTNGASKMGVHVVRPYDPTRRTSRKHRRVVRQGTELFDADGVKLEPSDIMTKRQREADDDRRILGELPPHWAVFSERGH